MQNVNKNVNKNTISKNFPSYLSLKRQSPEVSILTYVCKDFVITDEEFFNHPVTQAHMDDAAFWVEMASRVNMRLSGYLSTEYLNNKKETPPTVLDYIMCFKEHPIMNDIIIQTVSAYLNSDMEDLE